MTACETGRHNFDNQYRAGNVVSHSFTYLGAESCARGVAESCCYGNSVALRHELRNVSRRHFLCPVFCADLHCGLLCGTIIKLVGFYCLSSGS